MRLIGLFVILCAGMAGQGATQKRPQRTADRAAGMVAEENQRLALLFSLLDTFAQCKDRTPDGADLKCDVYYAQVNQTPIDVLLSPALASKLKAKLTVTDIEDLKSTISINLVNAYYYGKGKQ
jgi:hypothetical protein